MKQLMSYGTLLGLFALFAMSLSCVPSASESKGFLHCEGTSIVDGSGENFIIRGLGPGGWMLQEGYMFHTKVGTQHEIRHMLESLTDKETTDHFYDEWLKHFFIREDVKRCREWGFNSIRVPIHYNLFTPAFEDEPVSGQITWKNKGFEMLDSLLAWCTDNEIYLVIDLHAAPGGQGTNASISDYDSSKPSLWESEENMAKTVALWQKLAERYKNESYIGGYDLLNETNWSFPDDGNNPNGCDCEKNEPLLKFFERTIKAIRQVDNNHIIFIEGNCWANNFKGLHSLASLDDNLSFSFHKYWNKNTDKELEWALHLRDSLNVPLYLGETGENSNTWFSEMVALVEKHNIGWSQWAFKQMDNDDPYTIVCPSWKVISDYNPATGENKPEEDSARIAMFDMLQSIKTNNCRFNAGVVNAYLHPDKYTQNIAYREHNIPGIIYASNYDHGSIQHAWFDTDYNVIHSEKSRANKGGVFRNDGVDIKPCGDLPGNGFCVSWTEKGEWMNYSLNNSAKGNYNIVFRLAGKGSIRIVFSNGEEYSVKVNENLQNWQNVNLANVEVVEGLKSFRIMVEDGSPDINFIEFKPINSSNI